jgi:predicted nuclease with TOPRIM domain
MSNEEIIKENQALKEELEKMKNELMETMDKLKNYTAPKRSKKFYG